MKRRAQKIETTEVERQAILEAREHYGKFFLAVNPGFGYVRYQQELIVPELERLERGDNDRLIICIEPGHAKTRLCTAGFAPWLWGRRPDREIIIISYGAEPAAQFGQVVRDVVGLPDAEGNIKTDMFKLIFPWCKIRRDVSARTYFQNTLGGKIHAVGWKGAIAATRADFIIVDDPHKNQTEATSDRICSDRTQIFNSVVKDRLKPGGKILICTNRWAPRDLVGRVLEAEGATA